ncbi:MAG: hypothetical protein ACM3O6_11905, partial [Acidobacteriota bacterium]
MIAHVRSTRLLAPACAALGALWTLGADAAETQPKPKRGGILEFSVEAEPGNYDCHANISFAFVHPVAPHYSTLL